MNCSGNAARTVALFALLGVTPGFAAETTTFPQRPVRWIVPFVPGGSIDLVGRVVAQTIYFLASPLSSYVTGQFMAVDGGGLRAI